MKKKIEKLLSEDFIKVDKIIPEEIEFFSKLHGVTEPENYRKDYIPSGHGGRTKGDNKIHFYPDSKAFLKCTNTDDVIKECMDNLLVHEIFHYLIRLELKGINDRYKDKVQSFLEEGLV